jgi:hypothetical protein
MLLPAHFGLTLLALSLFIDPLPLQMAAVLILVAVVHLALARVDFHIDGCGSTHFHPHDFADDPLLLQLLEVNVPSVFLICFVRKCLEHGGEQFEIGVLHLPEHIDQNILGRVLLLEGCVNRVD